VATELNFTARLDTSQFLSQVDQARTQFGLAFGGSGVGGVGGAMTQQFQQMFAGMPAGGMMLGGSGFGQTFTNPAMAYSPFYGAVQATTQLDQEWSVHRYGMAAAAGMKPPGVSTADYALAVERNFIGRQLEASHQSNVAARSSFSSGVGGMIAGEGFSALATPIGAMAGGAIASRLFGAGAAGAGAMVGGVAAGWFAFNAASDYVGEKIQSRYAEAEKIGGLTRELGEIAGAGRGLGRGARYDLGVSARQAAGDLKMDVNEMADVLSLGRQAGMLPSSSDPNKAREQYRDFARAIEEGAQVLGTSLAGATQVIKAATAQGMSAQEGVIRAAGAGGPEAFMAQMAQRQMVTSMQVGMSRSPVGNLQLMAGMGGQSMGGMSMAELPGAAMAGLMAGGGDYMSNIGKFMVHQEEYRKGIGVGGARTMARAQLSMGGDMIQQFMPDLSANEAQRLYAQSMGLDPSAAKLLVGGGPGSGAMSGTAQMQAISAMQSSMLPPSRIPMAPESGSGWGGTVGMGVGAVAGWFVGGGPMGAFMGAQAGRWVGDHIGDIGSFFDDGPSAITNPRGRADWEQRRMAAEEDARIGVAKSRMGYLDIDPAAGGRFLSGNLRGARLDLDAAGSPIASYRTAGMMAAMGLGGGPAGAGTVKMGGGYVSAMEMQSLAKGKLWDAPVTSKDMEATMAVAHSVGYGASLDSKNFDEYSLQVRMNWQTVLHGETPKDMFGGQSVGVMNAGENLVGSVRRLISAAHGDKDVMAKRAELLGMIGKPGGVNNPQVRAFLEQTTGAKFEGLGGAFMAGRGGAAAMKASEMADLNDEAAWLYSSFTPQTVRAGGIPIPARPANMTKWEEVEYRTQVEKIEADNRQHHTDNKTMPASFYKELQSNRHYLQAKEAILDDEKDSKGVAKKHLQQAMMEVQVAGGDRYRTAALPVIDPTAAVTRPGAAEISAGLRSGESAMRGLFGAVGYPAQGPTVGAAILSKIESDARARDGEVTTWAQEVKNEKASGMAEQHKAKLHPTAPGMAQRAIGFGEQESAMASIQRSLKSTERSLSTLEKKISGMGANPQPSNNPQLATGGKP
jgi:hypothetical protein